MSLKKQDTKKCPRPSLASQGFTIVELLVVIVVIAILAFITIIAYNGISSRANVASLQSDLASSATQLKLDQVTLSSYPATTAAANNNQGLKASTGTTYQYTVNNSVSPQTFCLTATKGGVSYYITNDGAPTLGACPGDTNAGAVVATLVGSGTSGFADGTGTSASFNGITSLSLDASGNIYVPDYYNYRIRTVTPAGVMATIAGSSTFGYLDGTGATARFNAPRAIATDSSSNSYVLDTLNYRVRKVTSSGVVTTLAGSGTSGYTDGTGTAAQFRLTGGIAVDSAGNVYVADSGNNRIRKITSGGVVTTFAGSGVAGFADGTGTAAQFNSSMGGLAVDSAGNVYVTDTNNNAIRKITPAGVVTTVAGTGSYGYVDGLSTVAQFRNPMGVAVDSVGNVYVADTFNNVIRKISTSGMVTTLAGSGTAGYAEGSVGTAKFNSPQGIAADSSGTVYVADTGNYRIRTIK